MFQELEPLNSCAVFCPLCSDWNRMEYCEVFIYVHRSDGFIIVTVYCSL